VVPCSLFRTLWPQSAATLTKTVSLSIRRAHGCSMTTGIDEGRVRRYFEDVIGAELSRKTERVSFAAYALGLLGSGERKSCEPIAARAAAGETDEQRSQSAARGQDRLLHFLSYSRWDDRAVRLAAARYTIEELEKEQPVTTWIVDDTGFPKQGKQSVGVQRQYSGTLGKIGNCQIGVSLSVATRNEQVPLDFELYLPKSWIDDPVRRAATHIPEGQVFRTKIEQAVEMIERAKRDGIPGDIVLADAAYGNSGFFREAIRCEGMDYGVGIQSTTRVWTLDAKGRRQGEVKTVLELATSLGARAFRRVTWRDGTKGRLSSRFAFRRIKVEQDDGLTTAEREPEWVIMEWPEADSAPAKFHLTTLPRRMSKKKIVCILKERWRTEQAYMEMKEELGLDHFEGRSFPGWHHHVSVVLSCYAFVVAERRRLFPPSETTSSARHHAHATGAPLRGLLRHHSPRHRTRDAGLAGSLSDLSSPQCAE